MPRSHKEKKGREKLIRNKRSSGRPKDLKDLAYLERN
jgi:hypothetical protein